MNNVRGLQCDEHVRLNLQTISLRDPAQIAEADQRYDAHDDP
jgi:hypothetical protein